MKALIIPAAIVFLIVSACTDNRSSSTITKPANETTTSTKVEISTKPFVLPHDYPAEVKEALAKAKAEAEAMKKAEEEALEKAAKPALNQPFYMGTSRMGD